MQLIFKDVDFPVVAQKFFQWSRFFGFPYSSPSCRTRSGFPDCAVASSATGAVLSMYVAVLAQRQVPAALCAEGPQARSSTSLLGASQGYSAAAWSWFTPLFNDECDNFLSDPDGFRARIICPCLYRMRSRRFCARIEASFRKRGNSLSGLQVGEKAIQTFLCGGSRLPFGSGAIPFRVCKLAKRRSKRF